MKEAYAIQDLIDVQELAQIQDCMAKAIGFAAVITDPEGKPVTPPSHFSKACEMFHRPIAGALCEASDKALGKESLEQGGVVIRPCDHAGLMDAAVSITLDGRPIGVFLCGQVFFEPPKEELYRQKAKELGVDVEVYLKAIKEVPIVPKERFEAGVELMRQITRMLAEAGRKRLERQKAIEALEHAQAKMDMLFSLSPLGICEWRPGGELLSINEQYARMVGYTVEEVYAMGWKNLTAPEYRGEPDKLHEENALKGTDKTYQTELIHKDGHRVPIYIVTEPVFKQDGTVDYYISYVQDLTTIVEYERLIDTVLEIIPIGLVIGDSSGRLHLVNRGYARLAGKKKEELLEQGWVSLITQLITQEDVKRRKEVLERIEDGTLDEEVIERTYVREDGTKRVTQNTYRPIEYKGRRVVLCCTMDITLLKEAQEKFEELVEAQQRTIKELSTPIIPVWSRVIMAPMLGGFDSMRMHDLSERLLEYVASQKPKAVLLDLTGLAHVDTQVISEIVRLITSFRLLGSRAILVGIKPHVAQSLVRLGVSLEGVPTHATLEQGLKGVIGNAGHA